jgi:hypothetical protein
MKRIQRLAALTLAGGFFLAGAGLTTASAQWQASTRDRNWALRGDRFDTLRALARYLDDGAQSALAEAGRSVQYSRNGNDRAMLSDLRNFARKTADLTNRLYDYQSDPRGLDRQVRTMINDARRIDSRMRTVNAARGLYDDWAAIRDGLDRMKRFAAGYDVQVPAPPPQWADRGRYDDRTDPYGRSGRPGYGRYGDRTSDAGGFRAGVLTGRELSDFRAMAGELDQRLRRVTDMAERNYNARPSDAVVADLRSLAYQASALYDPARGSSLDVRDAAPIVERMLADVRSMDRSGIREAVGPDGWNDWQSAMSVLQRIDDMIRR